MSSTKGSGKNPGMDPGKSPGKADGQQDEIEVDADEAQPTENPTPVDRNPWNDDGTRIRPERPFANLPPVTTEDYGPPRREWLEEVNVDRERLGMRRVGFQISEERDRALLQLVPGGPEMPDLLANPDLLAAG